MSCQHVGIQAAMEIASRHREAAKRLAAAIQSTLLGSPRPNASRPRDDEISDTLRPRDDEFYDVLWPRDDENMNTFYI